MGDENPIRTLGDYTKPSHEGYRNTIELPIGNNVLLGVMECKVDILMNESISIMGRRESVLGMTSNTMYQLPSEPSRQEEFENLVMNFILNQEEKVKQLKEYMDVIGSDSLQLSLEVVGKSKEEIRMEKN
ncbi:hypothetical protein Tco_1012394 [Tanacetum coccineum]